MSWKSSVKKIIYNIMEKEIYDSDNDNKVDVSKVSESVSWDNVTNLPLSYPPTTHALNEHTEITLAQLQEKISDKIIASTDTATASADGLMSATDKIRLDALARTQSYTFKLTADMIAAKSVEISGSIAESAILMTKLKVEGSAGFIQACTPSADAEDKANGFYVRLKADGKFGLIDWIDNAEMWRAVLGEKVTVVYQGWAPAGAVVLCFSHFTEASVIANPFDFYGIVTYPEPDYAATWSPLNATNGYGSQWNRSESEVHFGYGGDPLGV